MVVVPLLAALALTGPAELRSQQPIGPLAADGAAVAFTYCRTVLTWSPVRTPQATARGGGECGPPDRPSPYLVALAGRSVAWFGREGGIHTFLTFFARPAGGSAYPVAYDNGFSGLPTEPPTVGLLGAGGSFVYTRWALGQGVGDAVAQQSDPNLVTGSTVYRLEPGSPPTPIARADGDYETFAFDGSLTLVGAAHGLVAYVVGGRVWLLDVARDVTCAVHAATEARLTSAGLFYAFTVPAPTRFPGRLRFVPIPVRC